MAYSENESTPVNIENKDKLRNSADLLPMFFRTEANKKFLGSTLDSLISTGTLDRINGFVGARNTENSKATDTYVTEITANRRRYNFLPSAIIKEPKEDVFKWIATYDDLVNQIKFFNGKTNNHERLFESEYYAWNPLFDFDKFVNYRQYYWMPEGPSPVLVSGDAGGSISTYKVTNDGQNAYVFTPNGFTKNPTITLYRGATYKLEIDAEGHPFNLKTALTTGIGDRYSTGVTNNGTDKGTIEITVPIDAPDRIYYACQYHQNMQGYFEVRNAKDDFKINVEEEIIGKSTFTSKNNVEFTNGMRVQFIGEVLPSKYKNKNFYVEGVGTEINLIDESELNTPESYSQNQDYEFDVDPFDDTPYDDTENSPLTPEYVTINRASIDKNPWSRYNRWVHKDVIEKTAEYNQATPVLDENYRAIRPILEFKANIQLHNFAVTGLQNIDLIDTSTKDAMSNVEGSFGYHVDEVLLRKGMLISFNADPDITVKGKIFEVDFVEYNGVERVHLIEKTTPTQGQGIVVKDGRNNQGSSWYFDGSQWIRGQQKTTLNQSPLFELYNSDGIAFSDEDRYPTTDFVGNAIASYKRGTGTNDSALGFPISYQNINNVGDITFNFDWDDSKFSWITNDTKYDVDTASGLVKINNADATSTFVSGWQIVENKTTDQRVQQILNVIAETNTLEVTCIDTPWKYDLDIVVEYSGKILKEVTDFTKEIDTIRGSYKLVFNESIPADSKVTLKIKTDQIPNDQGFYEPPINLTNNAENNDLKTFTLGSVTDHFRTIFLNNSNLKGEVNGINNSRDLQDIFKDGLRYVKHKGSLLPSLVGLNLESVNFINAIRKNASDYSFFKDKFLDRVNQTPLTGDVKVDVDNILYSLGVDKTPSSSYFYSDMAGYGKKVSTRTYTVKTATQNVFGIDSAYTLEEISDRSVYVYLNDEQLIAHEDYEFDGIDNTVTIKRTLKQGDVVIITDYDTTGNVIPNTPTKLGLYPKYKPEIYLDDTYATSQEVLQGHDGSITKTYGDERDALLLEFEKRIYNNIKVEYNKNVLDVFDEIPGYYRKTKYTARELDEVLRNDFGQWKSIFNIDAETNSTTDLESPFSYNYNTVVNLDNNPVPGFWRGIYKHYFDTDRPHTHPWEMLGMTIKPTWWDDVYGKAPYTNGNKILWNDLEAGRIKDPNGTYIDETYARPGLSKNIPVDEYGDLIDPSRVNILKGFSVVNVRNPWKYGDQGPAETAWRKSSWYPFALQIALALTRPAKYFGSLFDTNQNVITASGNLIYKDSGKILSFPEVKVDGLYYNNIRFKGTGYHVMITDFLKGLGKDVNDNYYSQITNTSMNLAYKLGGFANKKRLRVLAESSNPNRADNSVFLPEENYTLVLRKSNPVESVRISGIIVEKATDGFIVRGYDKLRPYFNIFQPITTKNDSSINVGGEQAKTVQWDEEKFYGVGQIVEFSDKYYRVKESHTSTATFDGSKFASIPEVPTSGGAEVIKATKFAERITEVQYGTKFTRVQEVYDVIRGYGKYLESLGFVFDNYQKESLEMQNWDLSGKEFLFWVTQKWAEGTIISLSPFAEQIEFNYTTGQVDNVLNSFYEYSILTANGTPMPKDSISTIRSKGKFYLSPKDTARGLYFAVLNLVQHEHVIVFDDRSSFGDVLYDQEAGYRQKRIKLVGFKTSEWNGDFVTPGFVFDEAVIQDWKPGWDYNIGDVVRFKSKFYSASKFLPGESEFVYEDWVYIGNKPVAELLPNLDYKAYSYEDFYSLESENFDTEATELAQHLIGYQKRDYLDNLIIDEIAQYKFYQGYIKEKGTKTAIDKIQRLQIDGVPTDVEVDSLWAFKIGSLGSNSTIKELELPLNERLNVENPQPYEFVNTKVSGSTSSNVIQVLPRELTVKPANYTSKPWPVYNFNEEGVSLTSVLKLPYAGYARLDDVTMTLFDKSELSTNTLVPTLDEGDTIWVARDEKDTWTIYRLLVSDARLINPEDTPVSIDNGNIVLHTNIPHGLEEGTTISIKDFDNQINGVHIVTSVPDLVSFTIATDLLSINLNNDSATGTILEFVNARVSTSNEINNVRNISEFAPGSKIWADNDTAGNWIVYEKTKAFVENEFGAPATSDRIRYGQVIKYANQGRTIIVGAPDFGDEGSVNILRRKTNTSIATLEQNQGYAISDNASDNLVLGARPKFGFSIDVDATGDRIIAGAPYASNVKQTTDVTRPNFIYADIASSASAFENQGIVKVSKYDTISNLYETEYVIASQSPASDERFGYSVVIGENRIHVGAPGANNNQGKVYSYILGTATDGSTLDWQVASFPTIQAPETLNNDDEFGYSMVMSDDQEILVISAPGKDSGSDLNTGSVYVYRLVGNEYDLVQTINTSTIGELAVGDRLGTSLAISKKGETLVIGAPYGDDVESNQGEVYIFENTSDESTKDMYTFVQKITSPKATGGESFGSTLAVNPTGTSVVVGAASGKNETETTLDVYKEAYDDAFTKYGTIYVNDPASGEKDQATTFDAGSTKIIDKVEGSGTAYTYTKLGDYFVYGQKINNSNAGPNDEFGMGLAYSETSIYVGAPGADPVEGSYTGSLFVYQKQATAGWNTLRQQDDLTDPYSIGKAFTYRTDKQSVVDFLETVDPIKGKLPYIVESEITYKSEKDPATYTTTNRTDVNADRLTHWTDPHVGELWWDLSTVRFMWYEQGDIEYRLNNWGSAFPGSQIDIYEWVETDLLPSEWNAIADSNEGVTAGFSGVTKYDDNTYVLKRVYNSATGNFVSRYYYWVKNSVIIPDNNYNRSLPAREIATIIASPQAYGIKSLQLLSKESFSLSNIKTTLSDESVSLSVQYRNIKTDIPEHNEWLLVGENQKDKIEYPSIINKFFDSLVGFDDQGNAVPDPNLPPQKKYGISTRPRQSMFVDRLGAVTALMKYTNDLMAKHRIVDQKDISGLFVSDPQPNEASGKYDVKVDEVEDLQTLKTQDLVQATATANIVNGRIKSVTITNSGYGYKIAPEVEVSAEGSGAKFKSTIDSDGRVTNIEVLREGRNYTFGNIHMRPFKTLVNADSTAGNYWTMYEWRVAVGEWVRTNTQTFDLNRFWDYADYVVDGFNTDSIVNFKISAPYKLDTIKPVTGDLVQIDNAGDGNTIILKRVESNGTWNEEYDIMYKANSTIRFNDNLFDYSGLNFGFAGEETFDQNLFDEQPNEETRLILNVLNNSIFVDDLKYAWNEMFFIGLRYAIEEQSFVDWAFKTSLIDVKNNLGGFSRKVNYNIQDPSFLQQYIDEVKPYSSTLREYVIGYDNLENNPIGTTDFDLPSFFDETTKKWTVVNENSDLVTEQPYVHWFDNYKYNVARIEISDPGEGYTEAPIVVISGGREDKPKIVQTTPFRDIVTTDYDNLYFYVDSTGIPDHSFVQTNVERQNFVFQIPRFPAVPTTKTETPLGSIGVAINGVAIFNAKAAETEVLNGTTYTINAVESHEELGIDDGSGHPQEDGIYHYHSDPIKVYDKNSSVHSPIIGFAFDGFPIYGPYGFNTSNDKTIRRITSSYRLKTKLRADGSTPNGRYVEDFEYVAGLGDLDENNGRFVRTPEYPSGTYAYFITIDTNNDPAYPYIVGKSYHGTPLLPNGNGRMPQSGNINATAKAYISRSTVGQIIVENTGAGYTQAPIVTITGGGGEVTKTAKAVAILENKKVRTNNTSIKFDRIKSFKNILNESAVDQYTSNKGQITYQLTFLPTLDKRDFDISINNETVYIENFDVSIKTSTEFTYKKQQGYITLKEPPEERSTVRIEYKKSINLMNAVDRIDYYYSPTDGMPGKDPAQLMTGIEYPGVEVQGLDFGVSVGWDGLPWFSHGWDTFSGGNTDYAFRADGSTSSFLLPYVPESGQEINVYFDGVRQDPTNTATIIGDGNTQTFNLSVTPADGVLVVFRESTSDGSLTPTDVNNLDTIIQGGNFAYNTATGTRPEDISLDGDGFVTPDTSHAPEEVVPGQMFDSVDMKIYNSPADGSPIIETNRYYGDGTTRTFGFNRYPGTNDSIYVTVAGEYIHPDDYTINYEDKTITIKEINRNGDSVDAPETNDLVTVQTLNVAGTNILERATFTGDGSTTEFLMSARFEDVKSAFVTVNGEVKDYVVRKDSETSGAIIDLVNPPVEANKVIQVVALSGVDKTFSEIKTDVFITDGSSIEYQLSQTPDKIEPFHSMAIVEANGERLKAPDTIYYVSNGITLDYLASQDPAYPAFSLALGELEVHQNGVKLVPISDYQFDTATNLVTFYSGNLEAGDVIAITILREHDYEINKHNDDDSTGAGYITLVGNSYNDSTGFAQGTEIRVTTFTNHDANLMRKEVFNGQLGGHYTIARRAIDSNYIWVELDGKPLVADRDYKVMDDGYTIYVDNKFEQLPTSRVVITSFSEDISYDAVGYRVFNDMLNRTHFKRISKQDTTTLAQDLDIADTEIIVDDASFFETPSPERRVPGVIWINKERIEFYKIDGNKLQQITRGTLGTGVAQKHDAKTLVVDGGPTQTMPYTDTINVFEVVIRDGLPNGKQTHVLETLNITTSANAHDQVEVYVGGRKLQKPTPSTNNITKHDVEIAFDSNETSSFGTDSDVIQVPEYTIEPVGDSVAKGYYKLVLRDLPVDGTEVKVIQRQGKVWYSQGSGTATNGVTLQRTDSPQSQFLLERTSGLPVINIRE